jgi:hypothetical protein
MVIWFHSTNKRENDGYVLECFTCLSYQTVSMGYCKLYFMYKKRGIILELSSHLRSVSRTSYVPPCQKSYNYRRETNKAYFYNLSFSQKTI